jgi:hypothetical protein
MNLSLLATGFSVIDQTPRFDATWSASVKIHDFFFWSDCSQAWDLDLLDYCSAIPG